MPPFSSGRTESESVVFDFRPILCPHLGQRLIKSSESDRGST